MRCDIIIVLDFSGRTVIFLVAVKKLFMPRKDVDMTEGGILGHIVRFSIPLMLGNLLQQLYNMVDTWVVGNFVDGEAFSAVGTVGPILTLLISFFTGFATGAGVVVSQYFGAKKYDGVKRSVHTAFLATIIIGLAMSVIGIALVPLLLEVMKMPMEVRDEATQYLTIYFAGALGLVIYNIGSGILRSVGDSTKPFYFLAVSAFVNTVLDLVFVLCFDMGVAGVAYATIIAQGVSAVLVIITLIRTTSCVKLDMHAMRIDKEILFKIVKIGLPIGLRLGVTAFSNVFVQSYINYFGKEVMGGWTAYSKIDQFVLLPMQSISVASTTFVGQNLGAGDPARAKKGVNISVITAVIATAVISIPAIAFAPSLVEFFNKDAKIIEFGAIFLRWITPFYVLCCINQIYSGALNGAGKSSVSMIILLSSFVGFRQLYLFVMANFISNTIIPISMAYPAGWLVCSTLMLLYYRKADFSKSKIVK